MLTDATAMQPAGGGYDLERGIEVDFKDVLKKRGEGHRGRGHAQRCPTRKSKPSR